MLYTQSTFHSSYIILSSELCLAGNTLEGDVSDVIAFDQLTSPFSPRKATKMSP